MTWVGCGSCGNTKHNAKCWKNCVAINYILVFVVLAFVVWNDEDYDAGVQYVRVVGLILGCIVMLLHCFHCFTYCKKGESDLKETFIRHSNQAEVNLKSSMAFKTNRIVNNAIDIHHSTDNQHIVKTCFGHALHVYSKHNKTEKVGGLLWAWKEIYSGRIFSEEGIWYSVRLIAANVSQYVVILYIILMGILLSNHIKENFDSESTKKTMRDAVDKVIFTETNYKKVEELTLQVGDYVSEFVKSMNQTGSLNVDCSQYKDVGKEVFDLLCDKEDLLDFNTSLTCGDASDSILQAQAFCGYLQIGDLDLTDQLVLLNAAGLSFHDVYQVIYEGTQDVIDQSVNSLYPEEEYMLTIPFVIGTIVAVLTSTFLAVSYLPSITSTTLQLRTGVIPTLSDKELNKYRAAVSN